jgi:serine/threonine protein kinase
VVHRDLKPANVLLEPTPGGVVPRVVDFGPAKALDPDVGDTVTRRGAAAAPR